MLISIYVKKIYMLRWRNWRLKYEGVQDRALKLYPAVSLVDGMDVGDFIMFEVQMA